MRDRREGATMSHGDTWGDGGERGKQEKGKETRGKIVTACNVDCINKSTCTLDA